MKALAVALLFLTAHAGAAEVVPPPPPPPPKLDHDRPSIIKITKAKSLRQINIEIDQYYAEVDLKSEINWEAIDNAIHDYKVSPTAGSSVTNTVTTIVPLDYSGATYNLYNGTMYRAQVLRIVDGDSFEASVVIWPDLIVTKMFRVAGIDAPESGPRKVDHNGFERTERARQKERQAAAEASWYAEQLLRGSGDVFVRHAGRDKYGRELVDVFVEKNPEGEGHGPFISFGDLLIHQGLAVPYSGGRKKTWGVE